MNVLLWILEGLLAAMFLFSEGAAGIVVTAVIFVLAVLVAWGRFGPYSFGPGGPGTAASRSNLSRRSERSMRLTEARPVAARRGASDGRWR
jgi:hypothetical protein